MIFKIKNNKEISISSKVTKKLKVDNWLNRLIKYNKEMVSYYSLIMEFEIEGDIQLGMGTIIAFNTKEKFSPLFRVLYCNLEGRHIVEQMQYTKDVIKFDDEFMVVSDGYYGE